MSLAERFQDVDDVALFTRVGDYLDPEVAPEFAELERRFWRHKIGEMAAQAGLTLEEFFARRLEGAEE